MLRRHVERVVAHPRLTIAAVLLVTVVLGLQLGSLETVLDPKRMLPQDHPYVQLNNEIERRFGGSRVVVIGVVARQGDIFTSNILGKISRITEAVKGVPGILEGQVVSLADRKIKAIRASKAGLAVTRMMPKVPETPAEIEALRRDLYANSMYVGTLISPDGRAAAIITDFRGGAAFEGSAAAGGFSSPSPPEGEGGVRGDQRGEGPLTTLSEQRTLPSPQRGEGQPAPQQGNQWWQPGAGGGWSWWRLLGVGGGGNQWWQPGAGSGGSYYVTDSTIYANLREIADREQDATVSIHLGGLPVALAFLEKDTSVMNWVVFPIAFAVVIGVVFLAFRTTQVGVLPIPILTDLVSVIWAFGLMGAFGTPLDPWTKSLTPILIVTIAGGHSIQILKRYYEELARYRDNRRAVIESTLAMAPITVTAGLVAAVSFASLATLPIVATFKSFGLFTAAGIVSALILELTLIPALRVLLRPPAVVAPRPTGLDRLLDRIAQLVCDPVRRRRLLLGSGGLFVVLLILMGRVKANNTLKGMFFERTVLRQDDRALNAAFSGTSTFYVLVQANAPDGLKEPRVMQAIEGLQQRLEAVPGVGRTQSYVDYLKRMNRVMHDDDPAFERVPESRALAAQELFLYAISGNPEDLQRLVDAPFQRAVLWAFLKDDSTLQAERLIRLVEQYAAEGHFGPGARVGVAGTAPVTVALNDEVVRWKGLNIVQIVAVAAVIVAVASRSLSASLFVILPLSFPVLVNFAVMGLFGIPLGIGTAAISAMTVGIGADYDIYLLFRLREEAARTGSLQEATTTTLRTAGKAIVFVALAISAGCAMLIFPGYYLHMEGVLMPLAMVASAAETLLLLPALIVQFRPAFVFAGAGGATTPSSLPPHPHPRPLPSREREG